MHAILARFLIPVLRRTPRGTSLTDDGLPYSTAAVKRDLRWLAAGALLLFGLFLGARDLWNPNEPLYGRAVAEMAENGDWLIPTVNGETFMEKPILYYWLALGAAGLLGGVNEFTLRVPSMLCGVVSVLMLYLLVLPYAGRRRAIMAATLFATTFGVFWNARTVQMDLLVSTTTLAAVLAATRSIDWQFDRWWGWSLAGLATGLGFLAKGPVGLLCPGMVVFFYLVATRRLTLLRIGPLLAGAGVFLIVVLPWFVMLWATGESASISEILIRQNFTRFLNPWDHQKPWWYFLSYFWIDMAPWAFLVPLAAGLPGRDKPGRRLDRLAWIWIASLIIFFSLSQSKRAAYILPIAPAVAMLASQVACRLLAGSLDRFRRRACLVLLGGAGLLAIAVAGYLGISALERLPLAVSIGPVLVGVLVTGGLGVLGGLLVSRRHRAAAPALFLGFVVGFYLLAGSWMLPSINVIKSARGFCEQVKERIAPAHAIRSYRTWQWRASYSYYLGQTLPRLTSPEELAAFWDRDDRVFLIVEKHRLADARSVLGDSRPIIERGVGSKMVYLFSNRRMAEEEY